MALALVSDRSVTAQGHVREVSPTIDPKSATVRVKIAIENPPAAMTLGSAVTGTATWKPESRIILPWSALAAVGAAPAVVGGRRRQQDGVAQAHCRGGLRDRRHRHLQPGCSRATASSPRVARCSAPARGVTFNGESAS